MYPHKQSIIRLCYRKVITHTAQANWDKLVFESSFSEYLLQAQYFDRDGRCNSYKELLLQLPAARQMHGLVGAAVTGYLQQLNNIIPDIVNACGVLFLPFNEYSFELTDSSTKNKALHQVAITFYSDPLCWHATIGKQLLVSAANLHTGNDETVRTDLFTLQPPLSIYSIREKIVHYATRQSENIFG